MTMEEAIKQAQEIATSGTSEEKEAFVAWCCASMRWNSMQADIGNKEAFDALNAVKKQYDAYLKALPQ